MSSIAAPCWIAIDFRLEDCWINRHYGLTVMVMVMVGEEGGTPGGMEAAVASAAPKKNIGIAINPDKA